MALRAQTQGGGWVLAKADQATCRPKVSLRTLQTNNERIHPEATIDDLVSTVRPKPVTEPNIVNGVLT